MYKQIDLKTARPYAYWLWPLAVLCLLLPDIGYCGQQTTNKAEVSSTGAEPRHLTPLEQAERQGAETDAIFTWGSGDNAYMLKADGTLTLTSQSTGATGKVPLGDDLYIREVQAGRYRDGLVLTYVTSIGDTDTGHICRLTADLKIKWCKYMGGTQLASAIGKDSLYMGGMGYVGRINLESSKILWESHKLDTRYITVCPLTESDATVVFKMLTLPELQNGGNVTVTLDRKKGTIIQTTPIDGASPCR